MAEFFADTRDIRFNLFDLFEVDRFQQHPLFKDIDKSLMTDIMDATYDQAKEVLFPANEAGDRIGVKFQDGKVIMPPGFQELYDLYCESGWNTLSMPVEMGGQGFPTAFRIASQEMFTAANVNFMFTPGLTHGAVGLIQTFGTDEQKALYVEKMMQGTWSGTMCLTEPSAGTAVPDLRSTAKPIPGKPGFYSVKGQKIFISSGDHELTENIVHLFLARVEGDPEGSRGISLFIVPKYKIDDNGKVLGSNDVACVGIEEKLGIHGSATCSLSFGDEDNCEAWLIGEQGQGLRYMFQMMNEARIDVGVQGVALSGLSYQRAVRYAKERIQGTRLSDMRKENPERVAIIEHPDVRRMLMDMKAISEGGRVLMTYGAYCIDQMAMAENDAEKNKWEYQLEVLTPIIKAWCSDEGFKACNTGVQVLGGYGYIREYGQEQLLRDVKIACIYEGANGVQAMDLLGRKIARKGGAMMMALLNEVNKTLNSDVKDGAFQDLVASLSKARDVLAATAMGFAQASSKGDLDYPASHASPFLQMFGDVLVGWLFLRQAEKAESLLSAILAKKAIDTESEAFQALLKDDAEARFLHGKIQTARYFVNQVVPRVRARSASIKSGDRSILDMVF